MNLTGNEDDEQVVETPEESGNDSDQAFNQLKELVNTTSNKNSASAEDIDDQRQATSSQELKERETHRKGEEEYYKLRNKWSWFIFIFIAFMLLFQLFVTLAIGYGWVKFDSYQTYLHLVIGQNFAQIVGMGIIVATFLFPKSRPKSTSQVD